MQDPSRSSAPAAIRALLERHYFRGMDELSFETFAPAFHPDARLAFVDGGALALLSLEAWRERLEGLAADPAHPLHHERSTKSIEALDVAGDTAAATVRFEFPSRTYTDFLTFACLDGRWQIVSKTFHLALSP